MDDDHGRRRAETDRALSSERTEKNRHLERAQAERESREELICELEERGVSPRARQAAHLEQTRASGERRRTNTAHRDQHERRREDTDAAIRREREADDANVREADAARRESLREREAREAAEEAVRSRDRFVAIVSHDLRNPLSVVRMSATQLLRVLPPSESPRALRLAHAIERAADRMRSMLDDLLDLAQMDAGRFGVSLGRTDARRLAEEAAEMMEPLAAERHIEVHRKIPEVGEVQCDRERILQVFSNLIGNAITYSGEGATITVRAERHGDEVAFAVADTGPGIPPDELPHVFDRYWQGKRPSRRGLGLGLSIVKGIVEAHHGRAWAESERGAGSTFSFTLPAAA